MSRQIENTSYQPKTVAYLTDVEGRLDKLTSFATNNPDVRLHQGELVLADGVTFVFGGDAVDRGPAGRAVLKTLVQAKERYGDRVVLLAGNRDINKLRLLRELQGQPPWPAPDELKAKRGPDLLKWILKWSMGAGEAFALRQQELDAAGLSSSERAVHDSFLEDISEGGWLRRFLQLAVLAYRTDDMLFVHGAVSNQSLQHMPGRTDTMDSLEHWIAELNAWFTNQVNAKDTGGERPPWQPVIRYQAPHGMTKTNPSSIVYGRLSDELGNPQLPEFDVLKKLHEAGVRRLIVGHTPCGDTPGYVSDGEFEVVVADNSYGRLEYGSHVSLSRELVRVRSRVALDDGTVHDVGFDASRSHLQPAVSSALGRRADDAFAYRGMLPDGRHVLARLLAGYKLEQIAVDDAALRQKRFEIANRRA